MMIADHSRETEKALNRSNSLRNGSNFAAENSIRIGNCSHWRATFSGMLTSEFDSVHSTEW